MYPVITDFGLLFLWLSISLSSGRSLQSNKTFLLKVNVLVSFNHAVLDSVESQFLSMLLRLPTVGVCLN
jgi:hypothetical protein